MKERPYQSRLLCWLNRQTIEVGDRFFTSVRTLKVAAIWGLQIMIYPLYLLVQLGRGFGTKLTQVLAPPSLPMESKSPPTLDTPIVHTLAWVRENILTPLIITNLSPGPLAVVEKEEEKLGLVQMEEFPQVRAIACCLKTQNLVLISEDNQVLTIQPEAQEELRRRILLEIATYYYYLYLNCQSSQRYLIPVGAITSSQVLTPMRFFWGLMRWVQEGSIAKAVNLFGENTGGINGLDWEKLNSHPFDVQKLVREAIDYFFSPSKNQSLPDSSTNTEELWLTWEELYPLEHSHLHSEPVRRSPIVIPEITPVIPLHSPSGIGGKIGNFWQKNIKEPIVNTKTMLKNYRAKSEPTEEIWLEWEDLYDERKKQPQPLQLGVGKESRKLEFQAQPVLTLTKKEPTPLATKVIVTSNFNVSAIELQGDYLDTESTTLGYIKHPLERILNFVDVIILAIEELAISFWQWLRGKKG